MLRMLDADYSLAACPRCSVRHPHDLQAPLFMDRGPVLIHGSRSSLRLVDVSVADILHVAR